MVIINYKVVFILLKTKIYNYEYYYLFIEVLLTSQINLNKGIEKDSHILDKLIYRYKVHLK